MSAIEGDQVKAVAAIPEQVQMNAAITETEVETWAGERTAMTTMVAKERTGQLVTVRDTTPVVVVGVVEPEALRADTGRISLLLPGLCMTGDHTSRRH